MKLLRRNPINKLNLHLAGVSLLLLLNLFLGLRLILAWHAVNSSGPEQLDHAQASHRALELSLRPLQGLPEKVDQAREEEAAFSKDRFPDVYSTISSAIAGLASENNVSITRISYTQVTATRGLAAVRMDASLSGEYSPLMHFINGLERSKTFFLIDGLTLTGQQGGMVNLRLRLTTYLRPAQNGSLPPAPPNSGADNPQEVTR